MSLFVAMAGLMSAFSASAQDAICARVKIEIEQELTFEREGFEARMTINNGLPNTALTSLLVTIKFADENGNEVLATSDPNNTTALFFLRLQDGSSIPANVATGTSATIKWLIIPAPGAGGIRPTGIRYGVGARLTYTASANQEQLDVSPDTIFVRPMPQLTLDYFLPGEVNGDDPFTPRIEEAEPFSLGVRITNSGYGAAKSLKIESSQPRIVDNRQGLLVNFRIEGASIDDQTALPTLLADFGTIGGGKTRVGRWIMTCSLFGRFVDFTARFSHADDLGGRLTSLIREVNAHLMLRDVLVDLPGRDAVRDFLSYRYTNGTDLRVYESEGQDTPVNDLSTNSAFGGAGSVRTLTTPGAVGQLYIKRPDPFVGGKKLLSIVRADGKRLHPANVWLSKTYDPNRMAYDYYFNLFDTGNSTGRSYAVAYENIILTNRAPKLLNPGNRIFQPNTTYSLLVVASDPDADALAISASTLPSGASLSAVANGVAQLTWRPVSAQQGNYPVTFIASDGALEDRVTITITVSPDRPRDAWLTRYFGSETNPAIIGFNADPDGDGLKNGVEYGLNLDPSQPEDSGIQIAVEPNGSNQLVTTMTYVRRTDDPALVLTVFGADSSRTAGNWLPVSQVIAPNQSNVADGMQRWKATDSVPLGGIVPRRFLELRASFSQ